MTELDQVIAAAYASEGKQDDVNKVYLTFLRTQLFLPVHKEESTNSEEPFRPLFTEIDGDYFMLAFDTKARLEAWAGENLDKLSYVDILGKDVVTGINDTVYLCLNYATEFYKEFSPDEVKKLKMIVARIDQMKNG